jgi:hypothetical protein
MRLKGIAQRFSEGDCVPGLVDLGFKYKHADDLSLLSRWRRILADLVED